MRSERSGRTRNGGFQKLETTEDEDCRESLYERIGLYTAQLKFPDENGLVVQVAADELSQLLSDGIVGHTLCHTKEESWM